MIEVPDNNSERRQHGFIKVDGKRDVDPPASQKTEDTNLEPDHQAGEAHNDRSPNNCPILGLFSIAIAVDLWFLFRQTEIISKISEYIFDVLYCRQHVFDPQSPFFRQRQVKNMIS